MSLGLLSGAHRAPDVFCALHTHVRQRDRLIKERGRQVQHMQKVLTQMNIQQDNVLRDIFGKSGLAILRAIVDGERDRYSLALYRDWRVKASEEEIGRSRVGNCRTEYLHESVAGLRYFDCFEGEISLLDKLGGTVELRQFDGHRQLKSLEDSILCLENTSLWRIKY